MDRLFLSVGLSLRSKARSEVSLVTGDSSIVKINKKKGVVDKYLEIIFFKLILGCALSFLLLDFRSHALEIALIYEI